jgi:hypothetical protein
MTRKIGTPMSRRARNKKMINNVVMGFIWLELIHAKVDKFGRPISLSYWNNGMMEYWKAGKV